ncbi:hypothetical protein [Petroclostridium sp. X23]|uniref:hypothetical protein n=1 Tax=Petroclostridium sp. X23 TaxID=3045146 RepID=UPI0024AD713A|nr:hypothetical protein [Petroclostridium sp. X23]WHH58280.1 hypothetical protein QKW49_21150 [Petroclostridium sp. X23]
MQQTLEKKVIGQKDSLISSIRGGLMEEKYDATYKFGNTTVNVVAPPPMTEEELQKRIKDLEDTINMILNKQESTRGLCIRIWKEH